MNENLENKIENQKPKKKKTYKSSSVASKRNYGIILTFLTSLSDKLRNGLRTGFFGRLFSSLYYKENAMLNEGKLGEASKIFHTRNKSKLKLRNKISALYEKSLFCRLAEKISKAVINSHIRLWGLLFVTMGAMIELVTLLRLLTNSPQLNSRNFFIGGGILIFALPMLFSSKRTGEALLQGRLTSRLALDFAGISEETLEGDSNAPVGYYSIAFLLGAILGLFSYVINPIIYLAVITAIVFLILIMTVPESGVLMCIVLLPFVSVFKNPSLILALLMGLVFVSFIFKWIRGKRVLKFEIFDIFVLIFAALLLFGGIATTGGKASLNSALLYFEFIMAYFLVVNMFRKTELVDRAKKLIIFSSTIIAIIGILQQGNESVNLSWIDASVFSEIGNRVTSLFANPNMLSIYLILAFPFVLGAIFSSETFKERLIYLLSAALIAVCVVLTWSRGAWLGLIIGTCVFIVSYNLKNIWIVLGAIFTSPIWFFLLPGNILERALSIGSFSDSSTVYRLYTWKGVWNMIKDNFFSGIGVGESAFSEVYPLYSYSGTETVMHSHSLYFEIALEIGFIGLFVFLVILFLYTQKCFEHIKTAKKENPLRISVIAGFSAIVGACVMGMADHIWYNYRVFLFFWIIIGITSAAIRINNKNTERDRITDIQNDRIASVDLQTVGNERSKDE